MNRHCIFLSIFILLAGTVTFSSCAKKSASVSNRQVYAESEQTAGTVKNAAYAKDTNTAAVDTADMQRSLDGTETANTAAMLDRQLIKEGTINFETHDIAETRQHIESLVQKYGAYISQEDECATSFRIYQNMTVRIPKAHFDVFVTELSGGVKKIDEKSITVQDVTEEFIDTTARLAVKKETEQGYLRLLNQAKTIKDILDIQNELEDIRSDIESIEGRLRYLKNSVNFSTLHISMYQQIEAASETGSFFMPVWDAINNPDASVGVCCSHKVVAVGFNTLRYDASVGVLNPPHE